MDNYKQNEAGILVPENSGYRVDAWQNGATGQGVPGIDSSVNTTYSNINSILNYQVLTNLYKTDWLTRKICMRPAKDATRKFVQFTEPSQHKVINGKFKEIQLRQKIKTAIAWSRLFGGAGIVMITKDADAELPLTTGSKGNLVDIEVYDKWDLNPVSYDTDFESPNYMKPLIYQTYEGKRFHYTRVCKFMGAELTRREWIETLYWGGSIVTSVYTAIKHMASTYDDARYILSELNIGILKIPNLTSTNVQGGPAAALQRRVNKFNQTKSNYRVAAIDAAEDFNFVNRTVAGLSEIMEQFKTQIVAATDMTSLILFGESPAGMNGDTSGEQSTYYDNIEDIRQDQIAPCIEAMLKADGYEGAAWTFESLWEMSDKDKSLVMQQSSAAIVPLINSLFTPENAIEQLNTLSVWDIKDTDDAPDLLGLNNE
jgi:hypothetical protein